MLMLEGLKSVNYFFLKFCWANISSVSFFTEYLVFLAVLRFVSIFGVINLVKCFFFFS